MNTESKKLKCGLVMPISAIDGCSEGHWEEVRQIIKEALGDTQFSVELVSDSNEIGIIQKRIVQNIYDNDLVICDVSAKNPNVMFELGLRLAFDKPAIIVKDDKTNYSFDTAPIEHLEYPRDLHYHTIQIFKTKLREKVIATFEASKKPEYTTFLKHFGQFVVAKLDEKKVGKDEYLLAAVSELRQEVQSLAKTVRGKDEYTNKLAELLRAPSSSSLMSEEAFLLQALSRRKAVAPLSDLTDPNSPEFRTLVQEYLEMHVPPNMAMKPRHVHTTTQNFLKALKNFEKG
jgi:hypothetical protein